MFMGAVKNGITWTLFLFGANSVTDLLFRSVFVYLRRDFYEEDNYFNIF